MDGVETRFFFLANDTMLDFVNTLVLDRHGQPSDRLASLADYIDWLVEARLIPPARRTALTSYWRDERDNQQTLDKVRAFRKNLHAMVVDVMAERPVSSVYLDEINYFLAFNTAGYQVLRSHHGLVAVREYGFKAAVHFMAPPADSALRFLTACDPRHVRRCENPACGLVFYDTSKGYRRRWCSMKTCGNRAKASSYFHKHRPAD